MTLHDNIAEKICRLLIFIIGISGKEIIFGQESGDEGGRGEIERFIESDWGDIEAK